MSWRGAAPIQLVIAFIGSVLVLTVLGIIALALLRRTVPEVLGTVCVASMTGLAGLLTPNTGLLHGGRTARSAELAGIAAATAVTEHQQLAELSSEAHDLMHKERE